MELFFIKPEVKVNGRHQGDILLSQQMLDAIKHITDINFFFQEYSAQVHCACNSNTVQLSEKCDFRVSPFYQVVQKRKLFEMA